MASTIGKGTDTIAASRSLPRFGEIDGWRGALRSRMFLAVLAATIIALVITIYSLSRFLIFVEARPGVTLPDPILSLFSPHDVSWGTFGVIYLALLVWLGRHFREPRRILITLQAYIVLIILRIAAMYVVPLEHPPGMLALHDRVVENFGPAALLTKDLFFSGHTSTVFLLFLAASGTGARAFFLLCTVVVAAFVLLQHVHYSVDVLVAPMAAYCCYRLVLLAWREAAR
ncbi:MAG: phosphatase PAP2-related protein [Candidatus Kapaibacterium sp.]